MNRGNLAEDPKSGLPSSSRYSRDGGEKNSLLYVDGSAVRKERRSGNQGSTVKGNHNSGKKRSVGRYSADSHMDRLAVGSDGRLFQVKEKGSPSISEQHSQNLKSSKDKPSKDRLSEKKPLKEKSSEEKTFEKKAFEEKPSEEKTFKKKAPEQASSRQSTSGYGPVEHRPAISQSVLSADGDADSDAYGDSHAYADGDAHGGVDGDAHGRAEGNAYGAAHGGADGNALGGAEGDAGGIVPAKSERSYLTQGNPLLAGSRKGKSLFNRIRVPLIAAAAAAALTGYGFTAWHYTNRFYPGTVFFGIPAAEMSVYDVKAAVKAKVDSYSLDLVARKPLTGTGSGNAAASDNVITAEDVAMVYRDNGEIDSAMKNQKVWAWPVMMLAQMFGEGDSALETTYDDSLVTDAVAGLACMQKENMIAPENAKVILTDDGASVQTEIYGTTLDREKTEEAVRTALNTGSTQIDLDDLGLYKNPKVYSSDLSLMSDAMALNKILGAKVLLRFGNRTEVINSEVISKMLDKRGSSYELNEEKLRSYVGGLADKYDTLQKERLFYTSIGTKITLEEGRGDYGWQLDQDATYEKLLEAIRDQKKTTIDPVYTQEAFCRDKNDIGETYVEISLTNQTLWFYKYGKLVVETPVVTGNPYAGHETPSGGVWSLKGRMRNQTLSGQGYNSPVDYWMPFNGGVGIHDMQSRAWFGGSIYLGSGSHGCINTPLAAVKLIYDQIEEGVPVIVYKDESEEAYSQVTGPFDAQSLNAQIQETYGTVEDDGIGSIVAWSRSQRAQAQAAAAAAQAASTGATAS